MQPATNLQQFSTHVFAKRRFVFQVSVCAQLIKQNCMVAFEKVGDANKALDRIIESTQGKAVWSVRSPSSDVKNKMKHFRILFLLLRFC